MGGVVFGIRLPVFQPILNSRPRRLECPKRELRRIKP
jgi:hypothetical protein